MLRIEKLKKSFGQRTILEEASYHFPVGGRVALVGPNGAGKTTLLNILSGTEEQDLGDVFCPKDIRIGYLPQEPEPEPLATVLLEAERGAKELFHWQVQMEYFLGQSESGDEKAIQRFTEAEQEYRLRGGYELKARAQSILSGLGYSEVAMEKNPLSLSGGWRMRLELAKVLISDPGFLILDEPTNHLDLPTMVWFEAYLKNFQGTLLFVSHDRSLLNRLSTHTLYLHQGKLRAFVGGFDDFLEQWEMQKAQQASAVQNLQRRRAELERFVERFAAKASKAAQAQSRVKMIARLDELESQYEPTETQEQVHFSIPEPPTSGKIALNLNNISTGYKEVLAKNIHLELQRGQKIAVIGMNGIGKSTLLKTITGHIPALAGDLSLGYNASMAYLAQDLSGIMDPHDTVLGNLLSGTSLGEGEARGLLGAFLFRSEDVFKSFSVLSGGEQNRLALAKMLAQKANILLLDEPTNHLDMSSVERLALALSGFKGSVIFVSHNRSFIDSVATHIFVMLPDGRHQLFEGQLADYERLAKISGFPNILQTEAKPSKDQSQKKSEPKSKASSPPPKGDRPKLEKKLAKLQEQQSEIRLELNQKKIAMAEVSQGDYTELHQKQTEIETLLATLGQLEDEWLELAEALERT